MSGPTEIDDKFNNICTIKGHLFLFHLRFTYNLCGKVPFLDKKKAQPWGKLGE
ncbi:hypothetical protein [Acinetobacter sp. YH01010]|uniref:hypothetical protein n=1 Tax=Acinetobacter sp. YH01010 TaxID=2601026 RepID=UPI0015D1B864|nr:hypothetical protein [Acinetobacter sp. YH01010]